MPAVRTMTALLTTAAALAAPSAAGARHGDGGGDGGRSGKDGGATEVRATGTCGGRVRSELRLKGDDDGIEVRLRVDHARRASTWSITAAQEGWVVWRGRRGASNGSFSLEL